jgi:pimeloyl-ACP methyl ester carboxylesterase
MTPPTTVLAGPLRYLDDKPRPLELYRQWTEFTPLSVVADDGVTLSAATAGSPRRSTIIVVSPLGASSLLVGKLMATLAQDYHVVTWESRGLPDVTACEVRDQSDLLPERHGDDLLAVVRATGARVEGVAAFCSGSYLAIHAMASGLIAPRAACLASPPVDLCVAGRRTTYQETFVPLLARIARNGQGTARLVRSLLEKGSRTPSSGVDAELALINNLPFGADHLVYRYALLHAPWLEMRWRDLLPQIDTPTLVVHGAEDEMVHPDTARALVDALPTAELKIFPREGHFACYKSRALLDEVSSFFGIHLGA